MTKTHKLPIGPAHVGLKEPVTAWLDIEGERIVDANVRPGAIHRGIEYMSRERNPIQNIYLAERVCGISSFSHSIAYAKAVEDAAKAGAEDVKAGAEDVKAGVENALQNL